MGPPHSKTPGHPRVRWLPEMPPLIILYKGRRLAGALNSNRIRVQVRFQLERELWFEFVSNFELIAIRNRKIARKWLLELASIRLQKFRKQFEIELASIAKVSKTIRKMERADSKTQC